MGLLGYQIDNRTVTFQFVLKSSGSKHPLNAGTSRFIARLRGKLAEPDAAGFAGKESMSLKGSPEEVYDTGETHGYDHSG